ncbi:MAG: hypothetical protein DME76_04895 [Verrucomicrobia bacterium]|nr:MAG: hypothetical protein DME76_04895 [Verrucomicrobiota bacterium]
MTVESKLRPCSDCGNLVSASAHFCPKCGRKFRGESTQIPPRAVYAIIAAVVVPCRF